MHDIIRFCHQAAIEAMFDLGDDALRKGQPLRRLVSHVPIDCRVFDLGGGLRPTGDGEEVTIEEVACKPMISLWRGMTDARICDTPESNYASFRFVGGATGIVTRSRRAMLIERLLARVGFETDRRADLVNARIRHRPAAEMEEALFRVGLVTGYVNHLDMALVSEAAVKAYEDAFLAGNYGFQFPLPDEGAERWLN